MPKVLIQLRAELGHARLLQRQYYLNAVNVALAYPDWVRESVVHNPTFVKLGGYFRLTLDR